MNSLSRRILVLPLLLFVLIFVCAACSNQKDVQNVEVGIAPVTQDILSTDVIDAAKPIKADEEQPVAQVTNSVEAAPISKQSVKEPADMVTAESMAEAPAPSTITISITSNEKKGVILEPTSMQWEDGDSVLDVLKRVTKSNKIPLEYKGAGMLSYVEGIANVYEFDEGTNSGWLFKINGKYATRSAGAIKLSIGDNVEWIYSIKKDEELDE